MSSRIVTTQTELDAAIADINSPTDELLTVVWEDFGIYSHELPADWVHVAALDTGGAAFHAFWSLSEFRYFWVAGRSRYWRGDLHRMGDFEVGDRLALLRAVRAFAERHRYMFSEEEEDEAIITVSLFTETWRCPIRPTPASTLGRRTSEASTNTLP